MTDESRTPADVNAALEVPSPTRAELEEELTSARIRLEQAAKRQGIEASPAPWSDVARQATALERVLVAFMANMAAVVWGDEEHSAERMTTALEEALAREQVRVELEATVNAHRELVKMELAGGPDAVRRPRLIT